MRHGTRIGLGLGLALLAGCGDPLDRVERLTEVPLDEAGATADLVAPAPGDGPGLFAGLFGADRPDGQGGGPRADTEPDEDAAQPAAATVAPRGGLLGLFGGPAPQAPATTGPDAARIAPGTPLPVGAIATVCGLSTGQLGPVVARGAGHALHDSEPGNAAPHAHYITGFADGCARQFTAAFAMLGAPGTHETLRNLPQDAGIPLGATDAAYEEIRMRVCRVARGAPCGRRLARLERDTIFVMAYDRFDTNTVWTEILLHAGAVIAIGAKSN